MSPYAARRLRDKWGAFTEILINLDNAVKSAEEVNKTETTEAKLDDDPSEKQLEDAVIDLYKDEATIAKGGMASEDIVVYDYLAATEYADGTLLDFFMRDRTEFDDEEIIRDLYPIVDALSGGQLAGLDFLSIKDMILMAIIYHGIFNMLVQSEDMKYFGFLLPLATYIPVVIAIIYRFKRQRKEKKAE